MSKKQKFVEVRIDYTDPETKEICIDAYPSDDDNVSGRTVARVSLDGEVIPGTNSEIEKDDLECSLVQEMIKEAKEEQANRKQELIDKVLDEIKRDVEKGDVTAIDELLKFCPAKNLKAYLPEEGI